MSRFFTISRWTALARVMWRSGDAEASSGLARGEGAETPSKPQQPSNPSPPSSLAALHPRLEGDPVAVSPERLLRLGLAMHIPTPVRSSFDVGASRPSMSTPHDVAPESIGPGRGLFQCTTCSRTYSRVDHLARHVRSHTQEKPYRCGTCDKKFSRVDLLRRHASVHAAVGDDPSSKRRCTSPGSSAPLRASKACEACAEHHLKCEDEKPCKRCKRKNINCIVTPRMSAGDIGPVNTNPNSMPLPAPIEAAPSMPNRLTDVGVHNENMAQSIYHDRDVLSPVSLDVAADPGLPPHQFDPMLSGRPQPAAGPSNVPLEGLDTLPSSLHFSNLPSGTLTPNGLFGFGIETDLDFSALDLSFIDTYNTRVPFELNNHIRHVPEKESSTFQPYHPQEDHEEEWTPSGEVLQQSIWRFVPAPTDGGFAEHANLSLPDLDGAMDSPESFGDFNQRVTTEKLDSASRDKILAIVLSQMRPPTSSALSAFPSAELLNNLIQFFLAGPHPKASSWIHGASFRPRLARPELLLAMAAYGAVLTPDRSLRKLGFAIQEVVRNHLPTVFEDDNTNIRDLQLQQAYCLHLEIGLWSGNSRKIEISESFQQPLLTILRRRGWLKRSGYATASTVLPEDEGAVLDKKWREWIGRESTKRLVYHLFGHDARSSISLLVSPLISYAELDLPLPESHELWSASSAGEWKRLYCEKYGYKTGRIPGLNECVANLDVLKSSKAAVDFSLSCTAVLHALWGLVWEYRKLSLLFCYQPRIWDSGLALVSRYQELTKVFDYYRITCSGESPLLLELISMHLHMSLEELQLFLGMEGTEQADRVHRSVQEWVRSKTSRQALWHAGQVFRATKALPPLHLRDFYAISLFHASLAFWAYGLASRMFGHDADAQPSTGSTDAPHPQNQTVWLDGEETTGTYRYISLGLGVPVLQGVGQSMLPARLSDPTAIMDAIIETIRHGDSEPQRPNTPLVENLISIMVRLRGMTLGGNEGIVPVGAGVNR